MKNSDLGRDKHQELLYIIPHTIYEQCHKVMLQLKFVVLKE